MNGIFFFSVFIDFSENVTMKADQRVNILVGEDDLEVLITSKDIFGIFGSNFPEQRASIVSHEWFKPFNNIVRL